MEICLLTGSVFLSCSSIHAFANDPNSLHSPMRTHKSSQKFVAFHSRQCVRIKSGVCHKFLLIVSAFLMFTITTIYFIVVAVVVVVVQLFVHVEPVAFVSRYAIYLSHSIVNSSMRHMLKSSTAHCIIQMVSLLFGHG